MHWLRAEVELFRRWFVSFVQPAIWQACLECTMQTIGKGINGMSFLHFIAWLEPYNWCGIFWTNDKNFLLCMLNSWTTYFSDTWFLIICLIQSCPHIVWQAWWVGLKFMDPRVTHTSVTLHLHWIGAGSKCRTLRLLLCMDFGFHQMFQPSTSVFHTTDFVKWQTLGL